MEESKKSNEAGEILDPTQENPYLGMESKMKTMLGENMDLDKLEDQA
jgi:hypothetical protein